VKHDERQVPDIKGILLELEQELLSPQVRRSREQMDCLLAQEFVEFGSSGRIYDKQSIIRTLTQPESIEDFQVEDFIMVSESDDTALVCYSCIARSADGDVIRKSNRSSLWKLIDGRWQMAFHQGTSVQ